MCMCFKNGTILWYSCVVCQLFVILSNKSSLKIGLQITFLFVLGFSDA